LGCKMFYAIARFNFEETFFTVFLHRLIPGQSIKKLLWTHQLFTYYFKVKKICH